MLNSTFLKTGPLKNVCREMYLEKHTQTCLFVCCWQYKVMQLWDEINSVLEKINQERPKMGIISPV